MIKKTLLGLLVCLPFMNCRQPVKPVESSGESAKDTNGLPAKSEAPFSAPFFTGYYHSENNQKSFFNCLNPDIHFLINDETGKLDSQYQKILNAGKSYPEDYILAELKGTVSIASPDTQKQGFDSILNVQQINLPESNGYQNACLPFDFWSGGKNPDWSVEVSKNKNIIRLHLSNQSKVLLFPYLAPEISADSVFTFRTENVATGQSLLIIFRKENCGASSSLPYSAHIIYSGLKLQGCAIKSQSF